MKIKSILFAFFALTFSLAAFSQDSTKTTTTTHSKSMTHRSHKSMGGKMRSKKMSGNAGTPASSGTNMADSTK